MHFSQVPKMETKRSKFYIPSDHKLTFNAGELIPIYISEVLPGDTCEMKVSNIIRMATPIFPVMDNAFADVYFFYERDINLWEHWAEFNGENKLTAWEQPVKYQIPQITSPSGGWAEGTIADYLGLPTKVSNLSVNHLPFRMYCKIWSDWFRDENLKDNVYWSTGDATVVGSNTGSYITESEKGALPLKVAKIHDYFTSALPAPQKGPSVGIPIGTDAPIITKSSTIDVTGKPAMIWGTNLNGNTVTNANLAVDASGNTGGVQPTSLSSGTMTPKNLWADLSQATLASINALRSAYAVQRFYEAQSRYGSRYTETLRGIWSVTPLDASLHRSEYLGGYRTPINITQVLQTSSTDATSPQGNVAAYSYTPDSQDVFTKSFEQHGYLMGVMCVRTEQTYQQGIERFWNRKSFFDFYVPQLANIGEQAILNKEIYATGTATDDQAFGYQEAWADYRYKPNRVSGQFRSNAATPLDAWHYAQNYNSLPTLSSAWIDEDSSVVSRTLAVTTGPQFIADFYFNSTWTREMPVYSVPGLSERY